MDTEEVLAKHRKALAEFADRNNIHIIETYYEVVSGSPSMPGRRCSAF